MSMYDKVQRNHEIMDVDHYDFGGENLSDSDWKYIFLKRHCAVRLGELDWVETNRDSLRVVARRR